MLRHYEVGQCRYLYIDLDGKVVNDIMETEDKKKGQRQKDGIEGGVKRSHGKGEHKGRGKRPKN